VQQVLFKFKSECSLNDKVEPIKATEFIINSGNNTQLVTIYKVQYSSCKSLLKLYLLITIVLLWNPFYSEATGHKIWPFEYKLL